MSFKYFLHARNRLFNAFMLMEKLRPSKCLLSFVSLLLLWSLRGCPCPLLVLPGVVQLEESPGGAQIHFALRSERSACKAFSSTFAAAKKDAFLPKAMRKKILPSAVTPPPSSCNEFWIFSNKRFPSNRN